MSNVIASGIIYKHADDSYHAFEDGSHTCISSKHGEQNIQFAVLSYYTQEYNLTSASAKFGPCTGGISFSIYS